MEFDNLKQTILQVWKGFSQRDQRAIVVLGGVLLCAILYFLIWLPSEHVKQQAQQKLALSQQKWEWLNEQLPKVAQRAPVLPASTLKTTEALMQFIQTQLREMNLFQKIEHIETQGQKVVVDFKEVNAPRLFRWLSQQEQQGLIAFSADLKPLQPGIVTAKVIFEVPK
ncbi:type II secretion system protein M [Hydrogenovibrio crunogenus]|uniref:Type II secretion system protein M n=1 Tax=Hydrogenovibrio crunogenus TaxID=39765 RepID=A0A4V1C8K7_9GAMM|nr:type II secretion system protein M [Hydrogenovibrio crunogenus]QBZ82244.1 type II secretion system protein M [Hydrogenovibrio crunogenus]